MDINWSQFSSDDLGAVESEADMLFQQGKHRESVDLLLQYEDLLSSTSYLSFCIGRNLFYLSDVAEARRWLLNAISLHPVFPWAFYELGRLEAGLNDLSGAAGRFCEFLECRDTVSYLASLNNEHRETILEVANSCFNVNRSAAVKLYRLLDEHGASDYLVQLRCAEDLLDQGQGKLAEYKIQKIQERQPLDVWGLFALSKARYLQNDRDGALQVLLDTLDATSKNDELMALACHRLIEINCLAEAQKVFSQHCGNRSLDQLTPAFLELYFRLAVSRRDHDNLKVLIDKHAAIQRIARWLIVEAVFKLTLSGDQITDADIHITSRLVAILETNPLSDLGTVLALFHFYARRRAWDRTDRLNQLLAGTHFEADSEVKLRQFDYLCLRARLSEAGDFVVRHYANKDLGQWEACSVMRYYAEAKRWRDAADILIKFIEKGFHFPTGEFFILQICRNTALHKQIIDLLDAFPQRNEMESKNLRQLLVDDICIRDGVSELLWAGVPTRDRCARENEILIKPIRQAEDAEHGSAASVFFTCTDKAYFFSVATLLVSYRANNPVSSERWLVFVDRDVPDSWAEALRTLASAIGIVIKIIREEAFVTTEIALQDTYGIFTGGNTLSRAAFFRIYAARYLLNNTGAARAIYLDSDIVCRDDLSEFRQLPFGGQLLLARAEEFSPEIRDASVKNGLDPSRYFNSGVLQFNLSGVGMKVLIDEAIRLAESEPEKLVFHDQCALNIAFFGRTNMLDARFNYFLRPARPENGNYSSAALLHYLDKPKPWDVTYNREYRNIWSSHAFTVRALLPADIFRGIVAAANGHSSH